MGIIWTVIYMKCTGCGHNLMGTEFFCPECGLQLKSRPYGQSGATVRDDKLLQELRMINRYLEEGNRQQAQLANAIGQLIANGALLNFRK